MYIAFFWMQGSTAWMLSLLPLSVSKLIFIVITALQLLVWCHHNEKFPLTEARSKIVERTKSGQAESSVLSLTSRANKHWCLQCRGIHRANTWLLLHSRALWSCLDGWVTACKARTHVTSFISESSLGREETEQLKDRVNGGKVHKG